MVIGLVFLARHLSGLPCLFFCHLGAALLLLPKLPLVGLEWDYLLRGGRQ